MRSVYHPRRSTPCWKLHPHTSIGRRSFPGSVWVSRAPPGKGTDTGTEGQDARFHMCQSQPTPAGHSRLSLCPPAMTQQGGLVWQCGLLCPAQTPEPRTDKLLATKDPAYGSSEMHTETHRPAFHRPATDKTPILCLTRRGGSEPPQRAGRSTEERWGWGGQKKERTCPHIFKPSSSPLPPSFPAHVPHKEITPSLSLRTSQPLHPIRR